MNRIAVVGHGPSLTTRAYGRSIDNHDLVVRMKWHAQLTDHPEIWGTKTDIVCGSLGISEKLPSLWPDVVKWIVFTDSRTNGYSEAEIERKMLKISHGKVMVDHKLCKYWDAKYRTKCGINDEQHTSSGFHALIYLAKYYSPCVLDLYGFDSMSTKKWRYSVTRGPDWDRYPNHRFDIENAMLDELCLLYNIRIQFFPDPEVVAKEIDLENSGGKTKC